MRMQLWTRRTKHLCPNGKELASDGDCCEKQGGGFDIPVGCRRGSKRGKTCTYSKCEPQYKIKLQMSMPERSGWLEGESAVVAACMMYTVRGSLECCFVRVRAVCVCDDILLTCRRNSIQCSTCLF